MPIYLPVLHGNTFYMINDFYCIDEGLFELNYEPLKPYPFKQRMLPSNLPQPISLKLDYTTPLSKYMTDYYDRLQESIDTPNVHLPVLRFGTKEGYKNMLVPKGMTVQAFSEPLEEDAEQKRELHEMVQQEQDLYQKEDNKPYKHFLMEIEGDSTEMFEDYWEQAALHEAAFLKHPLKILPFFHYDPRRYYLDNSIKNTITSALADKHSFFDVYEEDDPDDRKKKTYIRLHDFSPQNNPKSIQVNEYFDAVFFKGYNITPVLGSNSSQWKSYSPIKKKHSTCVSEYLYPNGPFIGIKVYPPLGYPADLSSSDQAERFDYPAGRFDNYRELFRHCIEHNLPVTAHASPLGMSIADGHNYFIRDAGQKGAVAHLTSFPKVLLNESETDRKDAALYVDEIATHPMHWKRLMMGEFHGLKLCLAHFSGMDAWTKNENDERKDWREAVIDMIHTFPNVFTDISCYTVGKANRGLAKALADKITDNEKLRWRILMGSDWYMAEMGKTGAGGYYKRMFELLAEVTRLLEQKGQDWDVWHQFAVVNPLLFMGLIETPAGQMKPEGIQDPKTGKYYYNLDTSRLEKAYENLLKKVHGKFSKGL